MILLIVTVGFAWLVLGLWCMMLNFKKRRAAALRIYKYGFWPLFAVGLGLGVWFAVLMYSAGAGAKIVEFPSPAAGWEKSGDHWVDFVGPITPFAMVADFLCGITLPQIAMAGAGALLGRTVAHSSA